MKTLIHIGYPKAASTWLQRSVFPAVNNFTFLPENVVSEKLFKPGAFVFNADKVRQFFQNEYDENILISDERFLGSFNLGWNNGTYAKELSYRLHAVFPEAEIILFIRRQPDIIASAYAQYVKDGGTISLGKYLYPPENFTFQNILKFSFEHLEYDRIIKHYDALFKGKVRLFLFEEIHSDLKGFLQRFKTELELDLDEDRVNPRPNNVRSSGIILFLNRFTNIFTKNGSLNKYYLVHLPGFHSFSKKFWAAVNRSGILGKPASNVRILGVKNFETIRSYYAESNHNLAKFIPVDLLEKYSYIS